MQDMNTFLVIFLFVLLIVALIAVAYDINKLKNRIDKIEKKLIKYETILGERRI